MSLKHSDVTHVFPQDIEEEEASDDAQIEWSDLIFLPFHSVFKLLVLFSVIAKSILGPVQSVYPVVYCWDDVMDNYIYLYLIKLFYLYCCDTIYAIDTFLHIVHRQVKDKALRRENLPKSAGLLLVDIISLIPFFRLVVTEICPPVLLWPNILTFSEFFVIYRVVEYFSLVTTHSFWNMIFGFTLLLALSVNCGSCFWLLLTRHGLCGNCKNGIYDWRNFIMHKIKETNEEYTTYIYSTLFVFSFAVGNIIDETKPSTIIEFIVVSGLEILGNLLTIFVVIPKIFGEVIIRLRRIFSYYPQVRRLVAETKRRHTSRNAYIELENIFNMIWIKRSGITRLPEIITEMPRCLRLDLKQDLVWPVFHHSPILRKSSTPLKRMICDLIVPDYKLPGEKLYSGINSHSHLYYLKSGVVQILSADDGTTPIISVTSGTIFGDISFQVPPLKCKNMVRCLTYCEVLYLTRIDYIRSLHHHPDDRRKILDMVKDRMKHARTLYNCKQHVRGLDRTEDEGIAWVKRRWWEVSDAINSWKNRSSKSDDQRHELPPEEAIYHCAKYIGQLVLCTDIQLQTKSLFANARFPWILLPHSSFGIIWHRVVTGTVFMVLILYPPIVTSLRPTPSWFRFFECWTDIIYAADICVSLFTAIAERDNLTTSFAAVMFARCKSLYFILDVMATIWTEYIVVIIGKSELSNIVRLNRLIKIYMLFTGDTVVWDVKKNPMMIVCYKIILLVFSFMYLLGYLMYVISRFTPDMTKNYFFGEYSCEPITPTDQCDPGRIFFMGTAIAWVMELMFPEFLPLTLVDVYYGIVLEYAIFLIFIFFKVQFIAAMYLKHMDVLNFQYFVFNLKKYYHYYKIHQHLLKRLDSYLVCQWKYFKGTDIMHPNMLKTEPYGVYLKVQGEVAEKIIGESIAFIGADPLLIRELAYASQLLILPKNAVLFLFNVQCKNVSWIVQGHIKCEFHNEEGELLKVFYGPGYMLAAMSVFLNQASLRTYSASTDCEILYINAKDFFKIIKRFPSQWIHFKKCINEFGPVFEKMFQKYLQKHRDYQKKLRERIFHLRICSKPETSQLNYDHRSYYSDSSSDVWNTPESDFMKSWMMFRALIAVVSIICVSIQGGSGAAFRWYFIMIGAFCDCIAWMDICIKIFLSYYDDRGLIVTDKMWCVFHYLTRGFCLDVIGALPWFDVLRGVPSEHIDDDTTMLMNTVCKFAHLYIILGYFDYIGDAPNVIAFFKILKWQLVSILVMFGTSHFLVYHCVDYTFDAKLNLVGMARRNECWLPKFLELQPEPTVEQLHVLYAESLHMAQSGLIQLNYGRFHINRDKLSVGIALFLLGIAYWFVTCYSLALLVLSSRSNNVFQHGVSQLRKFLNAERVEKTLIDKASAHFTYWWTRTKGVNIHHLINERIGVVLRQDLNYYFFKTTFTALDTLLLGGELLSQQLASSSTTIFVLPGHEIIRENDISSHVYVVHRGKVIISQDGEKVITLTKGCIFGQLNSASNHPVRVSAISDGYADLLQIHVKQFQGIIDDEIRKHIAQNPQSKDDYMATKKHIVEDPYDTIQYILRGRKTIILPCMSRPLEARHGNWYYSWLYIAWLFAPLASVFIALILMTLPPHIIPKLWLCFIVLDAIYVANFVSEFFTVDLVVIKDKCIKRIIGLRRFKLCTVYIDAVALLLPMLTYVTNNWKYQLLCLLRLRLLYDFHYHFCRSFKSKLAPVLLQFLIVLLVMHTMACGWIYTACRDEKFPLKVPEVTGNYKLSIDTENWVLPSERKGGCARIAKNIRSTSNKDLPGFVVPKHWEDDYIVAMTFIILLYGKTGINAVDALSLKQIYFKLVINFCLYIFDLWLVSVGICVTYTKFRQLYQYDYNVRNLITFLQHSGISPAFLDSVSEYTTQLWRRQKGAWLPELAQQAPMCLREDLMGALYMHHLDTLPLFSHLPPYFLRQLAARLQRIVIFPGKWIIQEGDIFTCIYFIHEGEVEKWFTDKQGESRMMSLLSTNGYFGLIPGLFPNAAFQFSYYTRTVVDFVLLKLRDWQDLLDSYPDVKRDFYKAAKQLKRDFTIHTYNH